MKPLDNPQHDREAGSRDETRDTTRTDDTRIGAVRALISPALLLEELAIPDATLELVERARKALADVGLEKKENHLAREISHGEQRQLELAIALGAAPRVLLLDEPAAGLSPEETRRMVSLVRTLKGRYTIVLIEHKIDIIMSVSDRISVMHFGSLIAEGSPEEIQRNPEVRRAYLGGVAA